MNIGLDLRMANEEYGIGRYGFELAKHIIASDRSNNYVLFVRDPAHFQKAGFETYKNVLIVKADFRHYRYAEQTRFPRLIRKHNVDLMHFLNFNVPLMYHGPFVVTIHDVIHHRLPGNKPSRFLFRMAYRAVIRHAARASKLIITVSHFSKREIIEVLKVPAEKIDVIYEAATPVAVSESDVVATRQKYGLNKPYLIFVGVLERKKNVPALTRAFDLLKSKYQQDVQLVLAGKEDIYYPEIIAQIRATKYWKDLVITGVISDKDKFALYRGAESFVSASLFEGFGLPGLEAMSLGIPLVVSNIPVFNEVYDNGAIYFDPNNPDDIAQKIYLLLHDSRYKELVANNAYARSQLFSWGKAARETLVVYEKSVKAKVIA